MAESSLGGRGAAVSPGARLRPRLSRTLATARWREYERLLDTALEHGYRVIGVEEWVGDDEAGDDEAPLLALRHDVDQHPRSVLPMAAIERDLGLRSAWYFRWRTADQEVMRRLREDGSTIGLHYETLSRLALERDATTTEAIDALLPEARDILSGEIATFVRLHGPVRSVCPHGDSRIPSARNASLVQDRNPAEFGVEFDVNEAMRGRRLARWLTDRSRAEGSWAEGADAHDLLAARVSPILCVVHPNNWTSGPSLWLDRLLSTALPSGHSKRPRRPLRTGIDAPPV